MLQLIFQGFMEWIYTMMLEVWQFYVDSLLDIMSMDLDYLISHIPIIGTISELLLAVGWALLLGNLVFQALKSMASGLGFEGEDPRLLFTRTAVFAFLLTASPQICRIVLSVTSKIIGLLQMPDAVHVSLVDESLFGSLTASWLLVLLFGAVIIFMMLKMMLAIAERYVIVAVLTITAPLAFGMGGSRNTADIFAGWCRMYGSMSLLMVIQVVFLQMLLSVLSTAPSGPDLLPWMILMFAITKVAKKADSIVARIGLNPAITGDSLGRGLPGALAFTVLRTAAAQMTKSVGRNLFGDGGGAHGTAPGGGGPVTGGPLSGRHMGMGRGTSGSKAHMSSAYPGGTMQAEKKAGAQQHSTYGVGQRPDTQEQTSVPSSVQNRTAQSQTAGTARKTYAPPGAHRSSTFAGTSVTGSALRTQQSGRPGQPGVQTSDAGTAQGSVQVHGPGSITPAHNVPGAKAPVVPSPTGNVTHHAGGQAGTAETASRSTKATERTVIPGRTASGSVIPGQTGGSLSQTRSSSTTQHIQADSKPGQKPASSVSAPTDPARNEHTQPRSASIERVAAVPPRPTGSQPGTAGTGGISSQTGGASSERGTRSTVRQVPETPRAVEKPPEKIPAAGLRPGTAGTVTGVAPKPPTKTAAGAGKASPKGPGLKNVAPTGHGGKPGRSTRSGGGDRHDR